MVDVHPIVLINKYLSEKVAEKFGSEFYGTMKFFPTAPTDINAFTENFPELANDIFAVYDRMFRLRKNAFPHIKSEQVVYHLYKMSGDPELLYRTVQYIYELLDSEDESGQDLNDWIASKTNGNIITIDGKDFNPIFFHNFRVYQLQETKDVIAFNTTRSFFGSKIIIEYNYHIFNN